MLTINATMLRPSANDSAAPALGGDPAGFSSLLRQTQAVVQPLAAPPINLAKPDLPAPADLAPRADAADGSSSAAGPDAETASTQDAAADEAPAPEATSRTVPASKTKSRNEVDSRGAKDESNGDSTDAVANNAGDAAKTHDATDSTHDAPPAAIDPAIAHWLAAQQRTAPEGAADREADAKSGKAQSNVDADLMRARAAASSTSATSAAMTTASDAADATVRDRKAELGGGIEIKTHAADAADSSAEPSATPAFAAALAEQRNAAPAPTNHAPQAAGVTAAALGATPERVADASTLAAAATTVGISTPVDSPDFAQALGVRLSVLAKDGVQHAELHLNPDDMGPVSVQIVMDGTQARIDFGADVAATRHAIETGLPELASALRDAGFTLAGGGVSSQAGGQRDSAGGQPQSGGSRRAFKPVGEAAVARVGSAARQAVARGGLDLYA